MIDKYYIPTIVIVFFLLSKEVFPDDSEFVIIACILTFITFSYYSLHQSLNLILQSRIDKIHKEFSTVLELKVKLENQLRISWVSLNNLQNPIVSLLKWISINYKNIVHSIEKNLSLLKFKVIKDLITNTFGGNVLSSSLIPFWSLYPYGITLINKYLLWIH